MAKISALLCVRNEESVIQGCLDLIHPFVDEIVVIDMQSTDKTPEIVKSYDKVKYFEFEYSEPVRMDLARTMSFEKATGDWCLIIDSDEYYPPESMKKIREFVENPGEAISARVNYYNLAWREGYKQVFEHYPDRLYRRDVFSHYEGILPLDMVIVKPEFRLCQHKGRGMEGVLEYDNPEDRSFEHPKQPILKDILFYHLARTRGFNFEYEKRRKYEKFTHPNYEDWQIEQNVRMNQWVHGLYPMEKIEVPDYIPTKTIPNPKVSVIIPCYNKAKWIGEAIESCLNQTCKPYEVICVDDFSSDNSKDIINNYDVIKIFHSQNRGAGEARNAGINKMTGDFFILLDADDKLHPQFIEKTLKEMKGDTQVVYTDFIGMGEWEGIVYKAQEPEQMKTAQVVPSTMALCDMRILDPYGNFKTVKTFEDAEFWLNCYYNRKMNFKHIPEPLCYYRRTQGSRIDYLNETKKERYEVLNNMYKEFGVNYA